MMDKIKNESKIEQKEQNGGGGVRSSKRHTSDRGT